MSLISKEIEGYEGLYRIHSDGKVWSYPKRSNKLQGCFLKFSVSRGYGLIVLHKNGVKKTCSVHRLVAKHFIENTEDKPCVNHKDGNRLNNDVSNLEWCTHSENIKHSYRELGRKSANVMENRFGKDHPRSKAIYKIKDGAIVEEFGSISEAVRAMDKITQSSISIACKTKGKIYKGFEWSFKEDYHAV